MAYSQEELNTIIAALIIDNNLNLVTPAKVRQVLFAISSSLDQQNAGSVSAAAPLVYDPFTNIFSIPKADVDTNGYLSKEDYIAFLEGTGDDPGLQEILDVSGVAEDSSIKLTLSSGDAETNINAEEFSANNLTSISKLIASGVSAENSTEIINYLANAILYVNKSTGNQSKLWLFRTAAGFAEFYIDPNKAAGSYIIVTRDELTSKANLVSGKVPQNELPSYVDDIVEGYLLSNVFYLESGHTTVIPAESGKIYIDITTGQKNKEYRYSGSTYIQITNGLIATSDDVPEGATSLYYTAARSALKQNSLTDVNFGSFVNGLTVKTTPIDADSISIVDSADLNKQKKVSLTNFKAFLKAYFDGIYQAVLVSGTSIKTIGGVSLLGSGDIPLNNQKTITGNVTLDDSYNGCIVKVKGTATISVPGTLVANFNAVFDVWSGFTATFTPVTGGSIIETALILDSDKMATLYKDGSTTVYKLKGQTT